MEEPTLDLAIGEPKETDHQKRIREIEEQLSPDQTDAAIRILTSPERSVHFLLGEAGSGKSFVVNYLRQVLPRTVVTATTGVAAQLVKGRTLHSFISINKKGGVFPHLQADSRMKGCGLLIIDEVSMASVELVYAIWKRFNYAKHWPRVLFVGDLLQLPPVKESRSEVVVTPLVEMLPNWKQANIMKLKQQHRQDDPEFLSILNEIRTGGPEAPYPSKRVREYLASHRVEPLPDGPVHLLSRRDAVAERNKICLDKLTTKLHTYPWTVKSGKQLALARLQLQAKLYPGSVTMEDFDRLEQAIENEEEDVPTKRARFTQYLSLKEGAQVMMLTNTERWVNGSTGVVTRLPSRTGDSIRVKLKDGEEIFVEPSEEEIIDANGHVTCVVVQYPMMLAWALTIHKSQGATIDSLAVDLENHFVPGMTYVALSRARRGKDLAVAGVLDHIKVDSRALPYA